MVMAALSSYCVPCCCWIVLGEMYSTTPEKAEPSIAPMRTVTGSPVATRAMSTSSTLPMKIISVMSAMVAMVVPALKELA